ncbi:putative nucleotidyltransferase substrate binding domain-containing protein [Nocardioides sp.]|uniref:putative nucleotidyltransferase substrate binding domain-containing protein n=1 Tax=Nocardioides sp. TaxID=35761 RepID=UPI00273494A3|nr:putative nucleotidyltransferase substrate binding domain-containing protein [Nocardioides sp.]MDP3891345.1 putative nucleotidyltransferase substrate binding domain-containing protein [Nocardioides sp.]
MALDVELAEIRHFLARHPPFEDLPARVLDSLPSRLGVEYYRRGSVVLPRATVPPELLVVRSGAVEVLDGDGVLVERGEVGTCHGGRALTEGRASGEQVSALEDTLVLAVPATVFHELREQHPRFAAYFTGDVSGRLRDAVALQQGGGEGAALKTHVRDLLTRPPVAVTSSVSIREAATLMADQRVSSLLVVDGDALVGILTDRDLRTRVLAAGRDPATPVAVVMTADPVSASADALAFEVLLEMVGRNIHHLPVVAEGRPVGMVTATDLLRLEQGNPVHLVGDIERAGDAAGVAALGQRLGGVVRSLVSQDASADDIGRVVTAVGDAVERRLLGLAEAELGPPPVPYAWVTLGSRARLEQALNADQDHALVLHDDSRDEHHGYFASLASFVTDGLLAAGYPLCRGEMMATNPRWRMNLGRWRNSFSTWLERPSPEAVLQASTFFDLRLVHGDRGLTSALQDHVTLAAPRATLFLTHLAKQAAGEHPPLGFFRGLVVEKAGEHRDTLDIKRGGAGIVVKLARIHALAVGSPETNTRARLADAVRSGVMSPELGADLRDAWEFISYVRFRHQADQVGIGEPPDNHVAPGGLSSFEKRHLRDAFTVVRAAQSALVHRYPVREVP